jgi:CBS domain-containing protein
MDAGSLLAQGGIQIPLHATRVEEGLALLRAGEGEGASPPAITGDLVLHPAGDVSLVAVRRQAAADRLFLGVTPEGLPFGDAREGEGKGLRILFLLEVREGSRVEADPPGALLDALSDPAFEEALLAAPSGDRVRRLRRLMACPMAPPVRVADALVPMEYRVYPDTPVGEVLDLMARKRLSAVPVVGSSLQVVGILTSGDAIRLHLEGNTATETRARDVMTRTVLCVTEDETLVDAARTMVNRNLRQLPVVRDGELVGFLDRESALRILLRGPDRKG